jgi:hypothetical protein
MTTYDTDSTCGTYKGDLVKDAVGNTTCYVYDALRRVTSTTYSGPYSANTPSRYFVYDAATVNSVAMAYAKTRLAEAYSCVSPCATKITDLGFSYTVLGQPTDVYESTPHSSGYYHVTGTYYANGALNTLSNLLGLPRITYGVDGEGRVNSASAIWCADSNALQIWTQLTPRNSPCYGERRTPSFTSLVQMILTAQPQLAR